MTHRATTPVLVAPACRPVYHSTASGPRPEASIPVHDLRFTPMRSLALPLVVTLLAAPAGAQSAAPALSPDSAVAPAVVVDAAPVAVTTAGTPSAAPTTTLGVAPQAPVADAAIGLRPVRAASDAQAQAASQRARRRGYGRSVALMATGGAAVVLGALAGGDAGGVLIFGGAIIGLIGLYDYLR